VTQRQEVAFGFRGDLGPRGSIGARLVDSVGAIESEVGAGLAAGSRREEALGT
jgi:hypothetical protein